MGSEAASRPLGSVDATLAASRSLVGVAAGAMSTLGDTITLAQFRALVLVADGRVSGPKDLAAALDIHPSNATRVVERMVKKELLLRSTIEDNRRNVALSVGPAGCDALSRVSTRRRSDIERILNRLPADRAEEAARALREFAVTAGDSAEEAWRLGWGS
jgi:DNA-binding MarR family transcriptional regulator